MNNDNSFRCPYGKENSLCLYVFCLSTESVRTQIGDIVVIEERHPSPSGGKGSTSSRIGQSTATSTVFTSTTTTTITTTTTATTSNTNGSISAAAMEAAGLMTLVKEQSKPMTIVGPSPQLTPTSSSVALPKTLPPPVTATTIMAQTQQPPQQTVSNLPPLAALTASVPPGSTGVGEKQRAIVKPHILTHIIEGFVIQEGSEPFPVSFTNFAL